MLRQRCPLSQVSRPLFFTAVSLIMLDAASAVAMAAVLLSSLLLIVQDVAVLTVVCCVLHGRSRPLHGSFDVLQRYHIPLLWSCQTKQRATRKDLDLRGLYDGDVARCTPDAPSRLGPIGESWRLRRRCLGCAISGVSCLLHLPFYRLAVLRMVRCDACHLFHVLTFMVVPPRYRRFPASLSLDPSPDCKLHPQYVIACSVDRRLIRRRPIRGAHGDGLRKLDAWRLAGTDVHFGSTARSLQDVGERVIRHRVCYLDLSVMLFFVVSE